MDNLRTNGVIEHADVAAAMKAVDRGFYVVKGTGNPYVDSPQGIGFGATISAPHMHAHCLEVLRPWLKPDARVLDVGSGTGYLTALFAQFVGEKGLVVGVDHIPDLVSQSEKNLRADGKARLLDDGVVALAAADGRLGDPEDRGPFDAIHVGAAAALPQALVDQLAPGGPAGVPGGPGGRAQSPSPPTNPRMRRENHPPRAHGRGVRAADGREAPAAQVSGDQGTRGKPGSGIDVRPWRT